MKKLFTLLAAWLLAGATGQAQMLTQADFTGLVVPQYASNGNNSGSATLAGPRLAVPFRATVSNLTAATTYRYYVQASIATDLGTTNSGAGNVVFINPGTAPGTATIAVPGGLPSLNTAGQYGTFTTDATGTFTGWFAYLNSANASRFGVPGTLLRPAITLATDAAPATIVARRALDQTLTLLAFNTVGGVTNGTLLRGSSLATAKNLAFTYDNTAGTGRPLAGTYLEVAGTTLNLPTASYAGFYPTSVVGNAGAYGLLTPNTNASGIQRLEQRALADGSLVGCPATDTDGTWPGGATTASPSTGGTAKVLTTGDTPFAAPTATTISPSDLPRLMTASTMVVSSGSMPRPLTNWRSTLIASTGNRLRYVSDE